jgi:predicted metal-dependent hydrolase
MIMTDNFKRDVLNWAEELNAKPKEIHIRGMKNKWASCSSKGRLTFSFALLDEPKKIRTEAIVHELLHLKYPNHGKMFKSLLVAYLNK